MSAQKDALDDYNAGGKGVRKKKTTPSWKQMSRSEDPKRERILKGCNRFRIRPEKGVENFRASQDPDRRKKRRSFDGTEGNLSRGFYAADRGIWTQLQSRRVKRGWKK